MKISKKIFLLILLLIFIAGGGSGICGVMAQNKLSVAPVAYWSFDQMGGDVAYDELGEANAIWQNDRMRGLSWDLGQIGNAAHMTGGAADKFIVDSDPIKGCTAFTISVWIMAEKFDRYKGLVMARNTPGDNKQNWGLGLNVDRIDSRCDSRSLRDDSQIEKQKWYHLCMTWKNNGYSSLYVNGRLAGTKNQKVYSYRAIGKWWIGDDPCCDRREFYGAVDDLAMFKKALSDSEIKLIYQAGLQHVAISDIIPGSGMPIDSIRFEYDEYFLLTNGESSLNYTVYPLDHESSALSWYSTDAGIVNVDQNGHLKAGSKPGSAFVELRTEKGGKTDLIMVYVLSATDMTNTSLTNRVFLYPNPVSSHLNIKNTSNINLKRVEFFNMQGISVLREKLSDHKTFHIINVSHLKSGNYLVCFGDQKKIKTRLVIKH